MKGTNVLVTGGAGFLGCAVVDALLEEGARVRVLAHHGESLENLEGREVAVVRGDVRSPADCQRAVEGQERVFHLAAIYRDYAPDPTAMYEVNLRGTFHVLEAARRAGVGQVIYTASVVALGRPRPGELGDERTPYEAWGIDFPYSRSKLLSMWAAEDFGAWGLDVRVVCPGMVFGPGDRTPTPSGKLILSVASGLTPAWVEGGCSYVDVRDAARVHVLASTRGASGERYVATAHNLDNREFLATVMRVAGLRRPLPKIPVRVARGYLGLLGNKALRRGEEPPMTKAMFDYSCRPVFYDNRKSITELGASYRPIDETIADAIAYFRARGRL
ncbi:MAG: SDR family NAD(P)-dependent oxidoreductase [Nannocystaceae bacterium]